MSRRNLSFVILSVAIWFSSTACTSRSAPVPKPEPHGAFDYYLLSLSWAPEFCATHSNAESPSECDPSRHKGFVVHGLWPQKEDGTSPQNCGPARPVAQDTVHRLLAIMPSRGLIQHEWAEHGTCSGLEPEAYFGQLERAYTQLQIPADYRAPSNPLRTSPSDVEQKFADANRAAADAFRISCHEGDLVGVEVCLTKDLKYRACGSGVHECRSRLVAIPPVP